MELNAANHITSVHGNFETLCGPSNVGLFGKTNAVAPATGSKCHLKLSNRCQTVRMPTEVRFDCAGPRTVETV